MSRYPHMRPEDVAIWELFIEQNPNFYETVDYDFRLGDGVLPADQVKDNFDKNKHELSQKRADVIGYHNGSIDIIEIKPRAGASALGQILVYLKLFETQHEGAQALTPVVITDTLQPDMLDIYASHNILVHEINPPKTE